MTLYRRPGAYYERIDRAGPGPVTLRTDIACFIGIAPEGPPDTPVPVESFRQFQSYFGGFTGAGYLAYAVKAFFENGGARAWIIRVASRRADLGARAAGVALAPAGAGWRAEASSPGHWGDGLEVRLIRERAVETAVDVAASSPVMLVAESVAGLERYDLVEIAQPGRPDRVAVIAAVEATGRRVHLAPPPAPADPGFAYPGQSVALDPGLPARLTRVSYALDIWRDRRFRARAAGLAPVREHPRYGPALLARPDYEAAIRHDRPVPVPPPVVLVDVTPAGAVPLSVVPAAGRLALTRRAGRAVAARPDRLHRRGLRPAGRRRRGLRQPAGHQGAGIRRRNLDRGHPRHPDPPRARPLARTQGAAAGQPLPDLPAAARAAKSPTRAGLRRPAAAVLRRRGLSRAGGAGRPLRSPRRPVRRA